MHEAAEQVPADVKAVRGKGRGSKFFVLGQDVWEKLWSAPTSNRMNLATAFLVMLAGTGSDHRLTKWSAKACEQYTGMGKPRGKVAIEELVAAGLVEHTADSTKMFPQYSLATSKDPDAVIFLPVQLVTGLASEVPLLRRIRETGDPMVLRMIVDLYGLVQLDATHGVSLSTLRRYGDGEEFCRKAAELGVHTLWALEYGGTMQGLGPWRQRHSAVKGQPESPFWDRVKLLQKLGAIWFEPWVFDGQDLDAEPLFPVSVPDAPSNEEDVRHLSDLLSEAAYGLAGDRTWILEAYACSAFVPLPGHQQPPALVGVCRFTIEPDTPGCRLSYAKRKAAIEAYTARYERLLADIQQQRFDRPLGTALA